MALVRRFGGLAAVLLGLAACQPCETPPAPTDIVEKPDQEEPDAGSSSAFELSPLSFTDLPNWQDASLSASLAAFEKSCAVFQKRDPESLLSEDAPYAGKVSDWLPACSVLSKYVDANELKRFYEDYFAPFELITEEPTNKLTGYYEPELSVSAKPQGAKTAPIPLRPNDLVEVKLGQFEKSLSGKTVWGRVENGLLNLYPARADIRITPDRILAFADPADVFFLQIQGSGRLKFPDGRVVRASFDSHNHRPFGSLANHLIQTGKIKRSEASMQGIRAWMKKAGLEEAHKAMNVNPRFVFFKERAIEDPNEGPTGASGLALTPMGSLAVDLGQHPMGIPFFLDTRIPTPSSDWKGEAAGLLLISQDTGGAIKGVRRGDIFFGWGDEAGSLAGRMNHEARFFVLLPQELAP